MRALSAGEVREVWLAVERIVLRRDICLVKEERAMIERDVEVGLDLAICN